MSSTDFLLFSEFYSFLLKQEEPSYLNYKEKASITWDKQKEP